MGKTDALAAPGMWVEPRSGYATFVPVWMKVAFLLSGAIASQHRSVSANVCPTSKEHQHVSYRTPALRMRGLTSRAARPPAHRWRRHPLRAESGADQSAA